VKPLHRGPERTAAQEQVADLLATAREALDLSVAFLSRLDDTTQYLEVVEASVPASLLFHEGVTQVRATSFCQKILDGELPAVIPDVAEFPAALVLPAAKMPRIRSYVSVPVRLSDGSLYGTFCAAGLRKDKKMTKRDRALMEVLARAAAHIIEPEILERERRYEIEGRLVPLMGGGGPVVYLQPIVDLATGGRRGAEALSRFPAQWGMAPDVCFQQAHSVGLGHRLELQALERAADHLDEVGGYVAMNVSPDTLLRRETLELFDHLDGHRVVIELSEHDPVADYSALADALAPLRASGARLAIDDVGAGFSSLRHIVATRPDIIKLDRSIVAGVSHDEVLPTLVHSLTEFAHSIGAEVVAEGIETADDAEALVGLGVDLGQGWHFGRPGPAMDLAPVGAVTTPVSTRAGQRAGSSIHA